ncbi:16396_t:CDS:2 [Racocetra fulgida]|uniref:16396_t:CDS:1 n=1 Tax=Racocetra fulgida TaxID=60492 RepID=A0A9N8VR60_9GLOM|nr:16396_t:CDS:2 [Racocetra fulgida]
MDAVVPPARSGSGSTYGAPCGKNYTTVNQTTISSFPKSKQYSISGAENITTFVDLSKAGATVGSQGVLQSVYFEGNATSPTDTTLYVCADIKITAEGTSPSSSSGPSGSGTINAPHIMFTLFIGLFLFIYLIF